MKLTFKIWLLIIFALLSLISIFSIPPMFLKEGVVVQSVKKNTTIFDDGLRKGDIITYVNGEKVKSLNDFQRIIQESLGNLKENQTTKIAIRTQTKEIINLYGKDLMEDFSVGKIPPTRLKTGLDIRGGARALVKADKPLSDENLDDLIAISEQRLNVYGLSDVKLFKVTTPSGERLMGIEIAGSTPEDLEALIEKQGKFEAKIGNETVFVGGNKDITYVGRAGQDAIISECFSREGNEVCNFQFVISLSEKAAKRHAEITKNLSINGSYLSKNLDLYLDGKLIDSLRISSGLRGEVATRIQISGSGSGTTRQEAIDAARAQMKKLQTVLITGSLPFKLKIVKLDKISPTLGHQFVRQIIKAGILAIIAVSIIVFVRYRKFKLSLALISVSLSEVLIILGVAALIGWNLDLPSIAGIISTIGTGIDSQLIILDEAQDRKESIKKRIKKALFIIVTAFTTTFVALIPLTGFLSFMRIGAASAGLLKGFAVTTLIGITTGVLITRPAFADIARQIEE